MRKNSPSVVGVSSAARFWTKVHVTHTCWEWTGSLNEWGYGMFREGRVTHSTHRWVWTHERGAIPEGRYVCHSCDNPRCVRPSHLFIGTSSENATDRERKGRGSKTKYGSGNWFAKLTEPQVLEIRDRFVAGETQVALAEAFGVHHNVIGAICRGKTWRHVPVSGALLERQALSKSAKIRSRTIVEWNLKRGHPPVQVGAIPGEERATVLDATLFDRQS